MAKYFTNPLLEGISGLVGRSIVCLLRSDILPIRGLQAAGVLRRLGQHASYGQILLNIRHAFTLATSAWTAMTFDEKQSWIDAAKLLSDQNQVFYSGIDYFIAYTMRLWGSQYGSSVYILDLTTSTDWMETSKANFAWGI